MWLKSYYFLSVIYLFTFQTSFGSSKTSLCTSKKSFAFLVQFLSEIVPHETGHYLKVTRLCSLLEDSVFISLIRSEILCMPEWTCFARLLCTSLAFSTVRETPGLILLTLFVCIYILHWWHLSFVHCMYKISCGCQVHISRPPFVPAKCRPLWGDYVTLAKTHLMDLKVSCVTNTLWHSWLVEFQASDVMLPLAKNIYLIGFNSTFEWSRFCKSIMWSGMSIVHKAVSYNNFFCWLKTVASVFGSGSDIHTYNT